jgi:flagellar hook-associated protein 1
MSGFTGIHIARLGMTAQQRALEVTSHNIANANTPGYSRQIARMVTTAPMPFPDGKGSLGSGVRVAEITRVRDNFLSSQIRKEMNTLGSWDTRANVFEQIEMIFMEPSQTGFNSVLGRFFDSFQDLSLNPESSPARAVLVENADALVQSARHINSQLNSIRSDIDDQISLAVMEINSLATQIKDLNTQIIRLVSMKETPGDLLDRRDILVDKMAELADFRVQESTSGSLNIYFNGRALVQEGSVYKLHVSAPVSNEAGWPPAPQITWERDGMPASLKSGQVGGLLTVRDNHLRHYVEDFASLVWGVAEAVNTVHEDGMDLHGNRGVSFFLGSHLETLTVNPELKANHGKIAAAVYHPDGPRPGDGEQAKRIAQLRYEQLSLFPDAVPQLRLRLPQTGETGTTTMESFYRDAIARLGVDAQESSRMAENQMSLLSMMARRQESISGVSLDEELANMVQFQLAYQASARLITTFDEILDTVINQMLR